MPHRLCIVADNDTASTIHLHKGIAECMGDGIFILFQTDEDGKVNQIVLTEGDLRKLLGCC